MVTKTQWHKFCEDIDRALYQYPEWHKTILFKSEEIDYVRNDVIYCKPRQIDPLYVTDPWSGMLIRRSNMIRTVFKHPESIPEDRRFKDLYNEVEVRGKMDFKNMRKWLK